MPSLRKWLLSGLLVLVPLIITLWVLEWVVSTLDQTLNILPLNWQPDQLFGIHVPGLGVAFALIVVLSIGALASKALPASHGWPLACAAAPHSGGALDLLGRQAGVGHLVFRKRQRLSPGLAGAVAAPRHVDHWLSHRHPSR